MVPSFMNSNIAPLRKCIYATTIPAFKGLVRELIDFNLRRGSPQVRVEVRTLLCILTKDNPRATDEMNSLLMTRIGAAIRGHLSNPELVIGDYGWVYS